MKSKQTIIQLHLAGMSQREIARKITRARNTVRKYIKEYQKSRDKDVRDLPITEEIMKKPTYKKRKGKMVKDETEFNNPKQAFDLLHQVLVQEKNDRFIRAKQNRIRAANFPQKKLLEELQEDALPEQARQKLTHLKSLDFIKEGQNVILTGSPETGKNPYFYSSWNGSMSRLIFTTVAW